MGLGLIISLFLVFMEGSLLILFTLFLIKIRLCVEKASG